MPALREAIAEHMCRTGVACTPSQVLITSGALQALQMISVSLLSNGSTVFAEAPSYIKSLQVFQSAGMRLSGVPMDGDGLRVDALERALRAQRGGSDAVLYTIPTNHNPTGITMRDARRHELIACCVANRLPIIEDNAYQDLYFDGPTPTPLKTLDKTGMVITLGSASKALSPGLRIGWLVASGWPT